MGPIPGLPRHAFSCARACCKRPHSTAGGARRFRDPVWFGRPFGRGAAKVSDRVTWVSDPQRWEGRQPAAGRNDLVPWMVWICLDGLWKVGVCFFGGGRNNPEQNEHNLFCLGRETVFIDQNAPRCMQVFRCMQAM